MATIRSTLRRTKSAASSGRRLSLLLGKPVLDGDIFSLNPSKLAQLLPERVHEDRDTGSSAWIQETNAEDFPCLLRSSADERKAQRECAQRVKRLNDSVLLHVLFPIRFLLDA